MFKAQKRFIAGAVCPKCSEMDKLVMYKNEEGRDVRECVACDYIDVMKSEEEMAAEAQVAELQTRVTPIGKAVRDEGEQAIKIFDAMPPSNNKH
ncbi:MAG: YheV family putative metal-binding protein [Gammaproteobacteria bacterium]|nr:YheV family putative metal-binding protein [Gammaproteobacteria bacterium]